MTKRFFLKALAFFVALGSGAALGTDQPYSFNKLGNDRVLLMNNDNNAACAVTLQGYNDTVPSKGYFWVHEGDPAPTSGTLGNMNLKDGTHHTYNQLVTRTNLGGATLYSTNVLWELVNCRAGSCVYAASSTTTPRNWIPWQTTAVDIDGTGTIAVSAYAKAGMISMQNTTDSCIYSPLYADGIGTIYFDAVNAWPKVTGALVLEYATNTVDGTALTRESTNAVWNLATVDVLVVSGPAARKAAMLKPDGKGVTSIALKSTATATVTAANIAKATGGTGGTYFYRVRCNLDYRGAIRFRIRRADKGASSLLDTEAYLVVDNILASPPPIEAEFLQYGKGFDDSRAKTRILGWEGAFTYPFAFVGTSNSSPWMRYIGKESTYYSGAPNNWLLSDVKFHYRWTYLGLDSTAWKTIPMVKDGVKYFAENGQTVDLSEGLGDIEYYYSAQIDRAPHYDPVDYGCGSAVTNTAVIEGETCKMPYGADWHEGQNPWRTICRRNPKEGPLPSGGTDWFVRVREGNTQYEDMAIVVTNTVGGGVSNIWMELVGDHSWRAYYYMPTNMAGKTIKFHFAGYNLQQRLENESFDLNTNAWYLSTDKIGYLPYNGAADGKYDAEVTLDLASTHLLFEFDDRTKAFAVSHAAYQDFNLWTDSAKGYMGYYSTTAAVSEAKQTFNEDFASWKTSTALSDYWNEDFNVSGIIATNSPYFPNVPFATGRRTPHGWTADNGMFVCQSLTNTEEGLSLQLEGCGRGAVTLENISAGDVPSGLGTVDFTARIAQPHAFDNFAWSIDGLKAKNYAFTAKADLSTQLGTDMSEGDPSISIVGYYRPYSGCYEARARRVTQLGIEFSLWKWEQKGTSLQARQLGSRYMAPNGGNIWSAHPMVNFTSPNNFSSWHTMAISMCNTPTGTVVQARLSRYPSSYTFEKDRPSAQGGSYNDQLYLIVTAVDNENPLTSGTYGSGTVNCTGFMGYPELRNITDPTKNPTNYPFNSGTLLTQEFTDDDWVLPAGRYRYLRNANGKNEISSFKCGICALVPEQDIQVQVARVGSADGNEWVTVDSVTVTNFQATPYTFEPMVTDDSYVRLVTGGNSLETRTDVAVDDISLGSWRGRDFPNIGNNYGQRTNWVYTGCWIESAVGLEGAYSVVPVSGTNEYCYIFTNAGKTVTFTPREDMYLSQALVVGGGGAGGWGPGGGGGGGGVYALTNGTILKAGEPVSITVGAGGNNYYSSLNDAARIMRGDSGGLSRLVIGDGEGGFDDYTAYGGGGGGSYAYPTGYGNNNYKATILATGGGQAGNANSAPTAGPTATGATTANRIAYGNGGGGNSGNAQLYVAGGGGGAGGDGVNGITNNVEWLDDTHCRMDIICGDGGPGYPSAITGKTEYYGGGGGGGDGLLYVTAGNNYAFDGHRYYGYYGTGSTWGSKYWMVRGSDATLGDYGNRTSGKGGVGGGGDGAVRGTPSPGKGGDGANGFGGGGGGGSSQGYGTYRPGGRGGDGAVILRISGLAQHQCVIQPTRGVYSSPVGIRSPWLQNGMGLVRFSYTSADTNAVLLLQVSTNMSSYAELNNRTSQLYENWVTLTNFTFSGENDRSGTKAAYVSLRAPVKGVLRLIADPDVVSAAQYQDDPNYGLVAITKIMCYDEPELDARSWIGWNMWTTGWDGEKANEFAYLYDGMFGMSCSLNWSAKPSDNLTGITGFGSDLAEPDKALGENEYAKSYPYVQGPAMTNGIGYVKFRARMMSPDQDAPSVVTLFGLPRPDDDSTAEELTNIVVDARRWTQYTWKSTADHSDYMAIRLAVKGAQGEGGRNFPTPEYYMDGTKIGKLQRVLIDEVGFSEPIAPRLALLNARPFRDGLTRTGVISNVLEEAQQPLVKESFGFQVQLQPQQLADDIDFSSVRVFVTYYEGTYPWGWKNWTNEASAVRGELKRASGDSLVWRSTSDNAASVAAARTTPGTVVQYMLWTTYKDNAGKPHEHVLDAIDWDGGPSWYWPIDYNKTYGGGKPDNFSAYTILDSVSPKRAWINEVNYFDDYDSRVGYTADTNQFIELAVPAGADMSGWYLRIQNRSLKTVNLCTIGADGIKPTTTANIVDHYAFLTVASPKTVAAGTLGGVENGKWRSASDLQSAEIYSGTLSGNSPYALELIRPSGVIEHQIVLEGTNYYAGKAWEWYGSGTNLCNEVKNADRAGNSWFFAGPDDGPGTLGVYTNHGESAECWTNRMMATPAKVNVGQTIDPEWYLPPSSDFAWIYATILGEHMYVTDGVETNTSAVFMVPKNGSTNIVFTLDPWYEKASITTNGTETMAGTASPGQYVLPLMNVTNTIDVYASARLSSAITDRVDPRDPYYNAITQWILDNYAEGEIMPARFIGLSGTVTNELSLKQMYWLDIPPTEGGWIFRAGMGGGLVDPSLPISQPCEPVLYTNALTGAVSTNVRVSVVLQLTNEVSGAWHAPKYLQGLEPGSRSDTYTGRPNWTSVTFKVTGALQNGIANNTWVPLRWFVFGPDSFDAETCTATIEITDPFSKASPAEHERWSDYPGKPVFYSWQLDESRSNYSTEMLKKMMINE
ncbi:MAG: hypothetical protein MJ240_09550 [Kiritimatiellae bacterium]|nr:hypothetical protein [Kiritimatiellia bacterium]